MYCEILNRRDPLCIGSSKILDTQLFTKNIGTIPKACLSLFDMKIDKDIPFSGMKLIIFFQNK